MTDLNVGEFRLAFPVFADEEKYPDVMLLAKYEQGKCYIADNDCTLAENCRAYALMLMLAHLLYIQDQVFAGNNTQQIASASEGPVSVSFQSPPTSSTFFYWLNATPYGSQIAAMLSVAAVSGFYVGGSPERAGFRKVGGVF